MEKKIKFEKKCIFALVQLNDNSLSFHILLSLVRFPSLTSAFFLLMLTHANTRLHRTTTTDSMMETRPKLVLLAWWRNWLKWIQLSKTYLDCGHVYIKQNNNTYMRMQEKRACSALVCVCILVCRVCVCVCVWDESLPTFQRCLEFPGVTLQQV